MRYLRSGILAEAISNSGHAMLKISTYHDENLDLWKKKVFFLCGHISPPGDENTVAISFR